MGPGACKSKASPREVPLLERFGHTSTFIHSELIADGWARILWTNDGSLIVVADRRRAVLFHATVSGLQKSLTGICTDGDGAFSDWILDIQSCPNSSSTLAVLTTRRFMLIDTQVTRTSTDAPDELHWKIEFTIAHQPPAQDLGMRLTLTANRSGTRYSITSQC